MKALKSIKFELTGDETYLENLSQISFCFSSLDLPWKDIISMAMSASLSPYSTLSSLEDGLGLLVRQTLIPTQRPQLTVRCDHFFVLNRAMPYPYPSSNWRSEVPFEIAFTSIPGFPRLRLSLYFPEAVVLIKWEEGATFDYYSFLRTFKNVRDYEQGALTFDWLSNEQIQELPSHWIDEVFYPQVGDLRDNRGFAPVVFLGEKESYDPREHDIYLNATLSSRITAGHWNTGEAVLIFKKAPFDQSIVVPLGIPATSCFEDQSRIALARLEEKWLQRQYQVGVEESFLQLEF